ncbi:MAG: hypothetical protein A2176_14940 [Spirochaetes bacterium RBG_13_51_14]|nr:MAG: hypothetical protein A2176_14940 [Spirochaetes bacterium RBG_13_51_14]
MIGQVYVKNNQYKIKGDFHHLEPGLPIRLADEGWRLIGITNPRTLTHMHSYGGEAPFFEALSQGKLLATRCDNPQCVHHGSVYQPFRIHCPDCLVKNTVIDMTDIAKKTSRIHTFMVCERSGAFSLLDTPIKFINVEFDGVCTILMSYLAVGDPAIGMRVRPIFKKQDPTFTILDLAFVPDGTKEDRLPHGFQF